VDRGVARNQYRFYAVAGTPHVSDHLEIPSFASGSTVCDHPTLHRLIVEEAGGDTKTRMSRRTLELPNDCVVALRAHRRWRTRSRLRSPARWPDNDLVFTTQLGTPLDAANVRRAFRQEAEHAGLQAEDGHRVSCGTVSFHCCRAGIPVEDIRICWATRTRVRRKRVSQGVAPGTTTLREGDG
jgi:hypothetical protein